MARILGVLDILGTSLHVLLYPALGEASGRPLALHTDFRCSRTHGEVAGSSGATGPGALLRTAPAFSFALPRRSLCSSLSLYFALPRCYSFASLVCSFVQWRDALCFAGAIFLPAPVVSFVLRQQSPLCCAGSLFRASPSLFFALFRCPLSRSAGCILCTSLALSLALRRQA